MSDDFSWFLIEMENLNWNNQRKIWLAFQKKGSNSLHGLAQDFNLTLLNRLSTWRRKRDLTESDLPHI